MTRDLASDRTLTPPVVVRDVAAESSPVGIGGLTLPPMSDGRLLLAWTVQRNNRPGILEVAERPGYQVS